MEEKRYFLATSSGKPFTAVRYAYREDAMEDLDIHMFEYPDMEGNSLHIEEMTVHVCHACHDENCPGQCWD